MEHVDFAPCIIAAAAATPCLYASLDRKRVLWDDFTCETTLTLGLGSGLARPPSGAVSPRQWGPPSPLRLLTGP